MQIWNSKISFNFCFRCLNFLQKYAIFIKPSLIFIKYFVFIDLLNQIRYVFRIDFDIECYLFLILIILYIKICMNGELFAIRLYLYLDWIIWLNLFWLLFYSFLTFYHLCWKSTLFINFVYCKFLAYIIINAGN